MKNIINKETDDLPSNSTGRRLRIAFFDYPDVFGDFYSHYSVDQKTFATTWHNTGSHEWLRIVQQEIGDITWYALSLKPEIAETKHEYVNCTIKFIQSSWLHRKLWRWYYLSKNSWKWRNRYYGYYSFIASYCSLFSSQLIKEIRHDKPDLIFVQEYCNGRYDILLFISWLLKIPIIAYHAGSTSENYTGKAFKSYSIPRADHIFPSGRKELERLTKEYKIPSNRLSIIRPPVDTNIYKIISRDKACSRHNLDTSKKYIVFIGRLDDSIKRVSSIITIFKKISKNHSDACLIIIGNGKDEGKLKQLASELLPDKIIFTGWIENDIEKLYYLNSAECLVLASRREGFPGVISEAFACGIPVIASDVGTISDLVIENKTGWLFPAFDDDTMGNKISWVLEHPAFIKSMRSSIREFAIDNISKEAITRIMVEGFSSVKYRK